ncbi:P-loop containing nucleoside triphosphate hydrolase protein [Chytriomyces sp. MP71]|nr:P-loop containing nucleoside triphosphate hydrolase protein [Chytriomyces sp. MP71]
MSNLIQRAKMNAELHYCPEIDTIVTDVHRLSIVPSFNADQRLGKEKLSWTLDFFPALQIVESCQTADTEFQVSKSILKWDSIGGYEEAIKKLKSLVLNPLENPASYERLKVKPPSGILLYGPSGCGKSLLVRTLAANSPLNFISVNGSKIFSKYLGDSESKVRKVFELARQIAPSIIFFDEIDILGTRREWTEDGASGVNERVLSTLLNEMDGVSEQNGVIVIGATSRPEKLDDALLRPGRLDHHLYIPLPDIHDRHEILRKLMLRKCELDFSRIAKVTDGFTPADLEVLIREAGYLCLRERDIDGSAATTDMQWKHISAALSGAMKGSMGSIFEAAFDRDIDGDEDAGAELSFWNSFGSGGMDTWCVSMLSQSTAETGEVQKILGLRGDSRPKTGWWSPGSCSKNDAEKFEIFQKGSRK